MAEAEALDRPASRTLVAARLSVGLAQGVVLYLLSEAQTRQIWPADTPALYAALLLVAVFVPLIKLGGLGRIRLAPLAAWALVATVVLAIFGWHDIDAGIWTGLIHPERLEPAFQVFFFSAVFVFVGHHLVGPADEARKLLAPYPLYFDWAWKDAVQIALAAAFVVVLWIALELGGALFALIGLDAVKKTIEQRWFVFPVTALAFAAAVPSAQTGHGPARRPGQADPKDRRGRRGRWPPPGADSIVRSRSLRLSCAGARAVGGGQR